MHAHTQDSPTVDAWILQTIQIPGAFLTNYIMLHKLFPKALCTYFPEKSEKWELPISYGWRIQLNKYV